MEEDNRKARKAARKAYNEAGKCCTECAILIGQPSSLHNCLQSLRLAKLQRAGHCMMLTCCVDQAWAHPAVRELAAFVRKRDKRVAAWQAELARQQQEREAQEKARYGCLILESPGRLWLAPCAACTGSCPLIGSHTCRAQTWQALPCHRLPCLPATARGPSCYMLQLPWPPVSMTNPAQLVHSNGRHLGPHPESCML